MKAIDIIWREPRAPGARGPVWSDWLPVAAIGLICAAEGVFNEALVWRPAPNLLMAALALALPWRRVRPLTVLLLVYGINAVPQVGARILDIDWTPAFASVFLLILPYSLLRWASGREAIVGVAFVFLTYVLTIGASDAPAREVTAGVLFLLFPAAIGASVRYREAAEQRALDQVRLGEREQLARELHDTVAHHVSAIAIQAQAGRALADKDPNAPLQALSIIEQAASNTLNEMRRMVRTMRSDTDAQLVPAATLADIARLADDQTCPLSIEVSIAQGLGDLDSTLVSTLFRLTQESITNAVRHAEGARRVDVRVTGDEKSIELTICDDGKKVVVAGPTGYGLKGMTERAALLGGTLTAGPGPARGWVVRARLPRVEIAA